MIGRFSHTPSWDPELDRETVISTDIHTRPPGRHLLIVCNISYVELDMTERDRSGVIKYSLEKLTARAELDLAAVIRSSV